jgi:hypothetical protein
MYYLFQILFKATLVERRGGQGLPPNTKGGATTLGSAVGDWSPTAIQRFSLSLSFFNKK